jgi:hypothetical protein
VKISDNEYFTAIPTVEVCDLMAREGWRFARARSASCGLGTMGRGDRVYIGGGGGSPELLTRDDRESVRRRGVEPISAARLVSPRWHG